MAAITRQRGNAFYQVAGYGLSPQFKEMMENHPLEPGRGSITGRVALERKVIHVHDVLTDSEFKMTEAMKFGGVRTVLGVPLLREGSPIGVIVLPRKSVQPFTEKQIELAATFADQAVIAIENVRLFEAEQQRTRELTESLEYQTAAGDILRVISSSPTNVQPVFGTIAESAVRLCGGQFSFVVRFDGNLLHFAGCHGLTAEGLEVLQRLLPRPADEGTARIATPSNLSKPPPETVHYQGRTPI